MHCTTAFRLHVAALLVFLPFLGAYEYEEIRKLNASCSPKDTCSVPRDLDNTDAHNCDCSSLCGMHDSCCIDSPFRNLSRKYERSASCRPAGLSGESVYMIDVCASSYKGPAAIRRRCEQTAKNWSDPFNNVPVTNTRSLKTYKSLFCGICNDEAARDLVMWHVILDCSSLNEYKKVCTENRDFVLNNMMYIREKGVWGLWSWDSKTDWQFRYLPMSYQKPAELGAVVKGCRPNVISKCRRGWKGREIERLCKAYMGVVYFDNYAFRNIHCALCNGVTNISSMSCHNHTSAVAFKAPALSFGVLLDINLKDGDKVGNVEVKCNDGQVFDPFSKKCRTIECPLEGYTLKEGKCVSSN